MEKFFLLFLLLLILICLLSSLLILRSMHIHPKTAKIQQFGWEYLKSQKAMGRPLSPHLGIYKPQLTWMISGGHRITGSIMTGTLFIGVVLFSLGPFSYTNFIERIRSWELPRIITDTLKFIIAWSISFYVLNGIRFLFFDAGKGLELKQVYRSGYFVLALSTLVSLLIVVNSEHITAAEKKAQQMAE